MKSPYHKGPLRRGEAPRMLLGTGILIFGVWGATRYLIERKKRTQANALVVRGPQIDRGERFSR